ncbi:MAG: hypothetical protein JOZ12_14890 [Sinobacteraceae bacterium]|nr:hypothetical protein [Nevskiaceae bacterium]
MTQRSAQPGAAHVSESAVPAVSWAAVFAGAVVAAAVSLLLLTLGGGFGLASVSPWPGSGASATTFTAMTAVWFVIVQWVASGLGGYLAGRLRTKWAGLHTHEVFFRDTAHGFISWAAATLMAAGVFALVSGGVVAGGVHAAATVGAGAAHGAAAGGMANSGGGTGSGAASNSGSSLASSVAPYDIDVLFRSTSTDPGTNSTDARAEAARTLARDVSAGDVPPEDRTYLTQLVASRTGVSQEEAQKRVDAAIAAAKAADTKARQAADAARKAAAEAATLTALAMLVGAFIACVTAALGGRRRDEHA